MAFYKRFSGAIAVALLAAVSAKAQTTIFDFESEPFTFNPPALRPGALTSLTMAQDGIEIVITRQSGVAFDLVQNVAPQEKDPSWGAISLDPFFNTATNTAFVANFSVPVAFVSLDAGDLGEDDDTILLEAFGGLNATGTLLGSDSFFLPGNASEFTFGNVAVTAEGIRSIRFVGGSPDFVHSVFYDNITVSTELPVAPEPGSLALIVSGIGLLGIIARRRAV